MLKMKQEYKCTNCGLEIVVFKDKSLELPKVECQDCGTKTMILIPPVSVSIMRLNEGD